MICFYLYQHHITILIPLSHPTKNTQQTAKSSNARCIIWVMKTKCPIPHSSLPTHKNMAQHSTTIPKHPHIYTLTNWVVQIMLPLMKLNSITDGSITKHRKTCTLYTEHLASTTINLTNLPDTQPTSITTTPHLLKTILFDSCPPQFHHKLQLIIDNNEDKSTLYMRVLHWNATTNTTNRHYQS